MEPYFKFVNRDLGDWDVHDRDGRVFCIRSNPDNVLIRDERTVPSSNLIECKSVAAAVAFITKTLMT